MCRHTFLARAILMDEEIELCNFGEDQRAFSYTDKMVGGVPATFDRAAVGDNELPCVMHNIGKHSPVGLTEYVRIPEQAVG